VKSNVSALGENGTNIVDLSRYGNNGTVNGEENTSWVPEGKYGGAYENHQQYNRNNE
jgi:hypothetical protein